MAEVVLDDVTKLYPGGVRAVDGLSLNVEAGELLVLMGPSGSGKTTLLRLVAGLERPTGGTIRLAGRDVAHVPPRQRDVALVFQNFSLYDHWTVDQNLAFGLAMRERSGWPARLANWLGRTAQPGEPIRDRVRATARQLGLEHLLERRPAELSGGEQQRVALGRALARRAAVLLCDEPLAHLDPPLRSEVRGELRRLQQRLGMTTVYVTHDPAEALALADRVAVISAGRLAQVGSPEEVHQRPATTAVARLTSSRPINLVSGRLVRRDAGWEFVGPPGSEPWPAPDEAALPAAEGPVTLGLRADDVRCGDEPVSSTEADWPLVGTVQERAFAGDGWLVRIARPGDEAGWWGWFRGTVRPELGQPLRARVRPAAALWFDAAGRRLLRRGE